MRTDTTAITVMTDHPAWLPSGTSYSRAFPVQARHAVATTDGTTITWCCTEAASTAPAPSTCTVPEEAVPGPLTGPLSSLGTVTRFRNRSLWDAIATAVIRQVVRAPQARRQYQGLCDAHGTPVTCGNAAASLFPSPEAILALTDAQFTAAGLAFKRGALRAAAEAVLKHEDTWACLTATDLAAALQAVRRIGPWTAGAAAADYTGDFSVYPCADLAVRTWAATAAPAAGWPGDEPAFERHWRQAAGPHLAHFTLLTLAWGDQHARTRT